MKKIFALGMAALMMVTAMATAISAAPAVDGRKTCTAYVADIDVDGVIDDAWAYAPEIPVDVVKENASSWFGDSSKVAGVDYATLTCKVLWDGDSTLYVLYVVNDKTISMVGANDWLQDSIELFVQMDNEASDSSASKTQQRWFADGTVNGHNNEAGFSVNGDTLIYEVEFDISAISGGNYIGIDFQYNDDAEGKGDRNVCLGWSDSTDKASSDCTVYGQCELSDTTVAELIAAEKAAAEAAAAEAAAAEAAAAEVVDAAAEQATAPATGDYAVAALFAAMAMCALGIKKFAK